MQTLHDQQTIWIKRSLNVERKGELEKKTYETKHRQTAQNNKRKNARVIRVVIWKSFLQRDSQVSCCRRRSRRLSNGRKEGKESVVYTFLSIVF